ncbi:prolipoprotein diacylglyceryl transferase [Pseudomonas sp. PhalM4]
MLTYPNIDPIALTLGPLKIYWYGLMYLVGIGGAWLLAARRLPSFDRSWTRQDLSDLIFWLSMGVILGGRIGYVLFYNLPEYLAEPWLLFQVWKGGMSFHGGFIGVIIAAWIFAKHSGKQLFELLDFIAPLVPIGLGAGRIGNFINGELFGKPTDAPWAMIFPEACDPLQLARHPSQLYQFGLEGVALFLILYWFSRKRRPTMAVSGVFAVCYGVFRFAVEFVRLPDPQIGYLAWNWLTMGQALSLPLIFGGMYLIWHAYKNTPAGRSISARA